MTRKTIENPAVDDVRQGDVVTITRGEKGEPGYVEQTRLVSNGDPRREACHLVTIRGCVSAGYRITSLTREAPDLPDHAGMLVFTDDGLALSDGEDDGLYPWMMSNGEPRSVGQLPSPVAAVAVPLKEWEAMLTEAEYGGDAVLSDAADALIAAARREHKRAGLPEVK